MIKAYACSAPGQSFEAFEYDPGPLAAKQVEIDVVACGVCHSDLSMVNNDWGLTQYPFVPGHEVVGTVSQVGSDVRHLKPGDKVGLGWGSGGCMVCGHCMNGDHNLCASGEGTIVGRHGGFANKVRCQDSFAVKLPEGVNINKAGPLFCGGITVFNPLVQFDVKPTDRVGVIGVGGLGHLAVQFMNAWGCEVTAFTSSADKHDELRELGAHRIVNSRDSEALKQIAGNLDFIISTVNVSLDWDAYLATLAPKGKLHVVGAVLEPMPISAFSLIGGQKSISGTPVGSPATIAQMLEFCARHGIEATTEHFPMSQVNEAMDHLKAGKARYRIVLENDLV